MIIIRKNHMPHAICICVIILCDTMSVRATATSRRRSHCP